MMDTTPIQGQAVSVAPVAPVQVQTPPAPVTPSYSAGGYPDYGITPTESSGGGGDTFWEWVKNTNWVELGYMILGSVALYNTIDYFRRKRKEDRAISSDIQTQLDTHSNQIATLTSTTQKLTDQNQPNGSSTVNANLY